LEILDAVGKARKERREYKKRAERFKVLSTGIDWQQPRRRQVRGRQRLS